MHIRSKPLYAAYPLLILYLWCWIPVHLRHQHTRPADVTHTSVEHCENVIYHAAVPREHTCTHTSHVHNPIAKCNACDAHSAALHLMPESCAGEPGGIPTDLQLPFTLPPRFLPETYTENKGPPEA